MQKIRFNLVGMVLALAIVAFLFAAVAAKADEYGRVKLSGTTSAAYTNTAPFYNAKILAVRAFNMAGAACTNTITVYQKTADGSITNTVATFTTATSGSSDVSTNGFIQLGGDILFTSATSNHLVEVVLDNRSR